MAKMSDIRKKAQDKLRRKFGYSTNDNYGRGTILYKADKRIYHKCEGYDVVRDMNVVIDSRIPWHQFDLSEVPSPIDINIASYKDYGEAAPENKRYVHIGEIGITLSLEELDLIHTIAHEMADENDWNGQIKRHKQRIRRKKNNK